MMKLKQLGRRIQNRLKRVIQPADPSVNALYQILYHQVHDLEQAKEILPESTRKSFSIQWSEFPKGEFLLSDPWFKENVVKILSEEELLLKREWFSGKKILDAGCGNGRWAYGFCQLGADLTCVDANQTALTATQEALEPFDNPKEFVLSKLEDLDQHLEPESFDLIFSWGVVHHCESYLRALRNIAAMVKPGGFIYLYLYGRESYTMEEEIELFKKRVIYNTLLDRSAKYQFLLDEAHGDANKVHNVHDVYSPLINRRFTFSEVKNQLQELNFVDIRRTIDHTELFIRASKNFNQYEEYNLDKQKPPYWFQSKKL